MAAIGRSPHESVSAIGRRPPLTTSVPTRRGRMATPDTRHLRVPGPQTPGLVSTTTIFAGLLLTLTSFVWTDGAQTNWTSAEWNEAIVGLALTALGVTRLVHPLPLVVATGVGIVLGGWLTLAPLILDYGLDPQSTPATIVDILIGFAVLIVTLLGHADARARVAANVNLRAGRTGI